MSANAKKNSRDTWLKILLPALLTATFYIFLKARPAEFELAAARKDADAAATEVVSPGKVQQLEATVVALNRRIENIKAKSVKVDPAEVLPPPTNRTLALQRLTEILQEAGLAPEAAAKAPDSDVNHLVKTIGNGKTDPNDVHAPQFYRISFVGGYKPMMEAMRRLSITPEFLVPVKVEMKLCPSDETQLEWTLTVWI